MDSIDRKKNYRFHAEWGLDMDFFAFTTQVQQALECDPSLKTVRSATKLLLKQGKRLTKKRFSSK